MQTIADKDQQIILLKKKVEEGTNELIKLTEALDRMRADSAGKQFGLFESRLLSLFFVAPVDPTSVANRSNTYELNRLKKQLADYEKELSGRDQQLNDVERQLRNFLDKNYELRDAVQEIRHLKEQLKIKDRQIEDLAQYASKNELAVHEVNDENEELRAKLGMDPRTPMTADQLKSARLTRTEANQAVVQVLKKEVRRI